MEIIMNPIFLGIIIVILILCIGTMIGVDKLRKHIDDLFQYQIRLHRLCFDMYSFSFPEYAIKDEITCRYKIGCLIKHIDDVLEKLENKQTI